MHTTLEKVLRGYHGASDLKQFCDLLCKYWSCNEDRLKIAQITKRVCSELMRVPELRRATKVLAAELQQRRSLGFEEVEAVLPAIGLPGRRWMREIMHQTGCTTDHLANGFLAGEDVGEDNSLDTERQKRSFRVEVAQI